MTNDVNKAQKPRRFLTQHQVIDRVRLCRATIYKMVGAGTFPRSHKMGGYSIRWLESDIEDFIDAVLADREWGDNRSPSKKSA